MFQVSSHLQIKQYAWDWNLRLVLGRIILVLQNFTSQTLSSSWYRGLMAEYVFFEEEAYSLQRRIVFYRENPKYCKPSLECQCEWTSWHNRKLLTVKENMPWVTNTNYCRWWRLYFLQKCKNCKSLVIKKILLQN